MKGFSTMKSIAAALLLTGICQAASAAEAFAEPAADKAGRSGYALSVFVDAGEEAVSFVLDMPKGASKVSTANCGREGADGVARCRFEPKTGKLAVVLFRLDGQPLAATEYKLGTVEFSGASMDKGPIQIGAVQSARRGGAAARTEGAGQNRSHTAER